MFNPAASVVIPTGNSIEEVLSVSRRNDFTQWGLPGGKQEFGESNLICAIREAKEETNALLIPDRLIPIYSGACYGKDGWSYWVTTYLYNGHIIGPILAEDEFQVKTMEMESLCYSELSPFHEYNRKVLAAWREFKG